MILDLDKLRAEGDRFIGAEPAEVLDLGDAGDIEIKGGTRYDLTVQKLDAGVDVQGALELDVAFRCSRCAEFFETVVREPAFATIAKPAAHSGSIDLTQELREAILLAFPTFPVCSSTCRGLCPQCGANLNRETCACRPPEREGWHALDGLNTE